MRGFISNKMSSIWQKSDNYSLKMIDSAKGKEIIRFSEGYQVNKSQRV